MTEPCEREVGRIGKRWEQRPEQVSAMGEWSAEEWLRGSAVSS